MSLGILYGELHIFFSGNWKNHPGKTTAGREKKEQHLDGADIMKNFLNFKCCQISNFS